MIFSKDFKNLNKFQNFNNFLNFNKLNKLIKNISLSNLAIEICELINIRPKDLKNIINLIEYIIINNNLFLNYLYKYSLKYSPIIIYFLVKKKFLKFDEIFDDIKNIPILKLYFFINDFNSNFYKKLKFNNFQIFNEYIHHEWEINSIGYLIKYDNLFEFKKIKIFLNKKILINPFLYYFKEKEISLLNLSIFYSSINCFNYLIKCGFKLDEDSYIYSIKGLNTFMEINEFNYLISNYRYNFSNLPIFIPFSTKNISDLIISLKNGMNINYQDEKTGNTSLHFAALYEYDVVIKFLLINNININIKNIEGNTALYYSILNHNFYISKTLIEKGLICDNSIILAIKLNDVNVLKLMYKNGYELNNDLFHLPTNFNNLDLFDFFLNIGFDINSFDKDFHLIN